MLSTLIAIFTLVLCLVCVVLVVFVLMQRPSADAGMGASLGGGAAENAFGGEATSFLTKVSVRCIVLFFVLTFSLFIANLWVKKHTEVEKPATASLTAVAAELEQGAKKVEDAAKDAKAEVKPETVPSAPEKK